MNDRRSLSLGVILLALGLFSLLRYTIGVALSGPGPILVLLGTIFLTLSALRRFRGPLLPGGVLLGLGAAFLLEPALSPWLPRWGTLVLGIGVGFLLVGALDAAAGRHRSPVPFVPGIALVAVALFSALSRQFDLSGIVASIARLWPWLLIAAGATLVAVSMRRQRTSG
jgi:hypothetical protein